MISSFDDILEIAGKKLSDEQRKAVFSDRATVVSAGAGSGKTTVLSLRFMHLLYDKKVDADRILTLTFTRKAASEMYERIHDFLSKAVAKDDSGWLKNQLEKNFPKAQISTMDGFWTEIARAGAMNYGISRDFSIMSTEDAEDMIDRTLEKLSDDESVKTGYMLLFSSFNPESIIGYLSDIASKADILTDYDTDYVMGKYSQFIDLLEKEMDQNDSLGDILNTISDLATSGESFIEDINTAIENYEHRRYLDLKAFSLKRIKGYGNEEWEELKEYMGKYNAAITHYKRIPLLKINEGNERSISEFISAFIKSLQKEKRASSMLSFADVERLASAALIDNRGIREYYKRRFNYIMIDESQDNNSKQKDILYLLSESLDSFSEGIPDASNLDKNKLFFVGDDKQSIYRFRGADVSVFNALKAEVVDKMEGEFLTLSTNYRSEPKLVSHFNDIFRQIFDDKSLSDEEGKEEALMGSFFERKSENFFASSCDILAGHPEGNVPSIIELDVLHKLKRGEKPDDFAECEDSEAEFIARKIEEIVSSSRFDIVEKGAARPAKYEDIAVLYSVTKAQMPLEKALRRHNIPYAVMESTSITVDGMASDFYSFLQLIVYPNDKKSFLTIMKSPFVRLSDKGMLEFVKNEKDGKFSAFSSSPVFESEKDTIAYNSICEFYKRLLKRAENSTIASLIEMLFYDSGYYTYIASDSKLAVYKEHFDYLWALANNADQKGTGLPLFLDSIRALIGSANKLSDVTVESLAARGVKLMTIHKSKGLEFPIVILADSSNQPSNQESVNRIADADLEKKFLMLDIGPDKELKCDETKPLAYYFNAYASRRLKAEQRRVLYVALTRAINHLIITAAVSVNKNGEESRVQNLYRLYRDALDSASKADITTGEIQYYKLSDLERAEIEHYDRSWYGTAEPAKKPVYNAESIGIKEVSAVEYLPDGNAERLPDFPYDADPIIMKNNLSADFGTLLHAALEEKLGGAFMDDYSNRSLSDSAIKILNESAGKVAHDFLLSDFYKKYIEGNEHAEEVSFYYPSDTGVVLSGTADLIVFGNEYNLVIDYKSDRYRKPEVHIGQLSAYARAVENLYGKPCYAMICYLRDFSAGPMWDSSGNEMGLSI